MDPLTVRLKSETFFDKSGKFIYSKALHEISTEFLAIATTFDALSFCAETDMASESFNREGFSYMAQRAIAALRAYDTFEGQSVLVESEMVRNALLADFPTGALMADVYEDDIHG